MPERKEKGKRMPTVAIRKRRNKKGTYNHQIKIKLNRDKARTLSLPSMYIEKQVKQIVLYIRDILDSRLTGRQPAPPTITFLETMTPDLRDRFIKAGLVERQEQRLTLTELWDKMVGGMTELSESTLASYGQSFRYLTEYFGEEIDPTDITIREASSWLDWLESEKKMKKASVTQYSSKVKKVFREATVQGYLDKYPFDGLKGRGESVPRIKHIDLDVFLKVLEQAPDKEFRALLILCYKVGLRVPSEPSVLRWSDVGEQYLTIHDLKNKRHPGREIRHAPMFPEMREAFAQLRDVVKPSCDDLIFPSYGRREKANYALKRCIKQAGLDVWDKPWNSFRQTADQDLTLKFDADTVSYILGHTKEQGKESYRGRDFTFRQVEVCSLKPAF